MGKKTQIENAFQDLRELYEKKGGKNIGFWWTIGGEGDEVSWLFSWMNLNNYHKAMEVVRKEKNYPLEELASIVISLNDKILIPI
jgi:hypothetical protein